jgi:peptide/nickel transport system ATP-binding protein/oligopeptide transport system ATP-binding protein
MSDLLSVRNLRTYFFTSMGTVKAVDGISMNVGRKESVALVGESGSGKTVTALSIMGLVQQPGKIVEGKVLLEDRDLLELSSKELCSVRGGEISIVFQDPMTFLNPVQRVGDQIEEALRKHQNVGKTEAEKRVTQILGKIGIPSPTRFARYYPHQLSGGMRQRVLIAIALSCHPSLLIADEPTTAVDVSVQAQIIDLLSQLRDEMGLSLLLITHDLGIVAELCDQVYIMYAGKIMEYADVFSLFEDPKHPYTSGLLKSAVSIDELRKDLVAIDGMAPDMTDPPPGCRFHPRCGHTMEICRMKEPDLVAIGSNRYVSCWMYERK